MLRLIFRIDGHTLALESRQHQLANLRVFPWQDTLAMRDQGDLAAEAGKRLGQFATNWTRSQHQQALRRLPDIPHRIRRQVVQLL